MEIKKPENFEPQDVQEENNPKQEPQDSKKKEFDPIDEIQKLKQNTVPKDEYESLKEQNERLYKTLLENGQIVDPNKPTSTNKETDVEELRKKAFESEHESDLDYIESMLAWREAVINKAGIDPAMRSGADDKEIEAVKKSIEGLKKLVKDSEGDDAIFHALYQTRVEDNPDLINLKKTNNNKRRF